MIALPILLVFLFAVLDVGRSVFLRIAIDDAAHAACQEAASLPAGSASANAREAALRAAPALGAEGLSIRCVVDYGERETVAYTHHLYDDQTDTFEEVSAHLGRQRIRVSVTLEGRYLTPLGFLLAQAEGHDGARFLYEAQATGVVDAALEGGGI